MLMSTCKSATLMLAVAVFPAALGAQPGIATPSAYGTIRESEIKADLFTLAGDAMRGREAGTLDEMRASMWIADQFRKTGLTPMGDDGTYFQWFNMRRTRVS